MSTYFIDLHY